MNQNTSLYLAIQEVARKNPIVHALHYEGYAITYQKLLYEIDRFANGLAAIHVKPGDIVTVCMPNTPEAVYALYAINRLQAICYEVHPQTPQNQMKRFMKEANSKVLIVLNLFAQQFLSLIEEQDVNIIVCNPFETHHIIKRMVCNKKAALQQTAVWTYQNICSQSAKLPSWDNYDPSQTAVYLNSGGTSGDPKVIALSNIALNTLASTGRDILGIDENRMVYMFAVLPMFHGFGLCMGIHAPLFNGFCATLMVKFHTKQTIRLIKQNKINILIGVPALYRALLKRRAFYNKSLQNIHVAFVGGDFVPQDLLQAFNQVMEDYGSKAKLLEGYGLTETVTVCSVNTLQANRKGSVGKALRVTDIKIVDVNTKEELPANSPGEICVTGKVLMNGYVKDPLLTNQCLMTDTAGIKWVLTGDYGYLDEENYLFFKQRFKRLIKVSGIILCPSDIENTLSKLPEIHEVYVTSIPDENRDNMIKLFVSLHQAPHICEDVVTEKIKQLIKNEVTVYALPKEIVYLKEMPHTNVGKIDSKQLESIK